MKNQEPHLAVWLLVEWRRWTDAIYEPQKTTSHACCGVAHNELAEKEGFEPSRRLPALRP